MPNPRTTTGAAAAALTSAALLAGCGASDSSQTASSADGDPAKTVTVKNCGKDVTYDAPVDRLFVNDGNMISIALAAGAHDDIVAVSNLQRHKDILTLKYGSQVNDLKSVADKSPALENILAVKPQVVFAGWSYGFSEAKNLTPDTLATHGIQTYLLSESCRQDDGARGTMPPWEALAADITNIGTMTGHADTAKDVLHDITVRREALEGAPKAATQPVAFLFDSGTDTVLSSGSFGAPQAVLETGGATNATADVKDTWTKVSWERLTAADPDMIVFVDYPGQSYEEKVAALAAHPASKDLSAVTQKRYINLPYAMWTSGPLNIDAAEYVRSALEHHGLQPKSDITPKLDLRSLTDLPGNAWLSR